MPARAIFDYGVTAGAPDSLTADGALDGISHCLEVLYSAVGKPSLPAHGGGGARRASAWWCEYLPKALANPKTSRRREALGLATDLGGYAIMVGGTNGAHLTSFSLVDILSHGRACGMMNPYYTVFFAPAIQEPLQAGGRGSFRQAGYAEPSIETPAGPRVGRGRGRALIGFMRKAGAPVHAGRGARASPRRTSAARWPPPRTRSSR